MFAVVFMPLQAQSLKYTTRPNVPEIKTLQTIVDGDFQKLPVIDMEQNASLEISFDYLSKKEPWLTYTVIHCDAEWMPDELDEMEYADGFFPVRITDVAPSFNTFTPYYHYTVKFPNDDVLLKVSGNYAVLIHPEDSPYDVLATAIFSVSEQLAFVNGEVSGNTDIDYRKTHQQLSLDLSWGQSKLPYLDPAGDLHVMVSQNRRRDTRRELSHPTRIEAGHAIYEHNRDLIFDAGNEYRRFEFTDHRFASYGVQRINRKAPYYYATLRTGNTRTESNYLFDRDQNGRYLVHALHVDDEATEADYFIARFMLKAPSLFDTKGIYITGDFTYGEASDEFVMSYDEVKNVYWKDVLLKQGAYNYQYMVNGQMSPIEGDFYETENEYEIYIYYRPNGARYDRLLGVGTIK